MPSGWPIAIAPPAHVDRGRVEPELADHRHRLRRERLVQLDEVELVEADTGPVEQLADGRDRPDAHHGGVDARDCGAAERPERLDIHRPRALGARDDQCGGAVVDPARVPGGHGALAAERGLQGREFLDASCRVAGARRARARPRERARPRSVPRRRPPPSVAATRARRRPDPPARLASARRRCRLSPPSSRWRTAPRSAG